MNTPPQQIALAMTGASGAPYGLALLRALVDAGLRVHLMLSDSALRVLRYEVGLRLRRPALAPLLRAAGLPTTGRGRPRPGQVTLYPLRAVEAAPASGSAGIGAMVICPCSMGTLGRVAHGYSSNLIERAADVALKEGRPLVLVPRETPLSAIHLENMLTLCRAGAVVLPAAPGFYHRPARVADLVQFVVGKVLDRLGIAHPWVRRWQTPDGHPGDEP